MDKTQIEKVIEKMKKRNYFLSATNGDSSVLYFNTPIGEKPHFCCEVYIKSYGDVDFKFKYITKKCTILSTDSIGSFFNDEHFNKFEADFLSLATCLYRVEYGRE